MLSCFQVVQEGKVGSLLEGNHQNGNAVDMKRIGHVHIGFSFSLSLSHITRHKCALVASDV